MDKIRQLIAEHFGMDIVLDRNAAPTARGNVFFGRCGDSNYVVKLGSRQTGEISSAVTNWVRGRTVGVARIAEYVQTADGRYYAEAPGGLALTVQKRTPARSLDVSTAALDRIGEAIGAFHLLLMGMDGAIPASDFRGDFLFGDVPGYQNPERLAQIEENLRRFAPDYDRLTCGACHNDLNPENVLQIDGGYLFIDFEHMKRGPLVSDLGVFAVEIWDDEDMQTYRRQLDRLLAGYGRRVPLTEYDKRSVPLFSLRYLMSDENFFVYLAAKGEPGWSGAIPELRRKQRVLLDFAERLS